jgi:hypothetical protein
VVFFAVVFFVQNTLPPQSAQPFFLLSKAFLFSVYAGYAG